MAAGARHSHSSERAQRHRRRWPTGPSSRPPRWTSARPFMPASWRTGLSCTRPVRTTCMTASAASCPRSPPTPSLRWGGARTRLAVHSRQLPVFPRSCPGLISQCKRARRRGEGGRAAREWRTGRREPSEMSPPPPPTSELRRLSHLLDWRVPNCQLHRSCAKATSSPCTQILRPARRTSGRPRPQRRLAGRGRTRRSA